MPFQPMNYSNIEPQGNPFMRDLVDNLVKGYKAGRLPFETQQAEQKQQLANAMSQMKNTEEPQRFNSGMLNDASLRAYQGASTNKMNTMTPLEAIHQKLINTFYPQLAQSQIDSSEINTNPQKKIDYIKALYSGLSGNLDGSSNGSGSSESKMFLRQALGLPLQTPEEKYAAELKLAQDKQNLKMQNGNLTTKSMTDIQSQLRNINTLLPMIDKIDNFDESSVMGMLSPSLSPNPNLRAKYDGIVNPAIDKYIASFKLPQVKESVDLVNSIFRRKPLETSTAYHKRLKDLKADLSSLKSSLQNNINPQANNNSSGSTSSNISSLSTDDLLKMYHGGG